MKNKIIAMLMVVTFILCGTASAEADTEKIPSVILYDSEFTINGVPVENDNDTTNQRNLTFDSGLTASEYGGFVDTVDNLGKGTSFRIGITEERRSGNILSLNIPIANSMYKTGESGSVNLDMDVYINKKTDYEALQSPYGNACFYMQFYGNTSSLRKRALVWDQKLYMVDDNNELVTDGESYDYDEKTWYTIRLEISWTPNGSNFDFTYNAYVSLGENGEMIQVVDREPAMRGASKITQIRMYAPILNANPTWIAIDNVRLYGERSVPQISSLAYSKDGSTFADTEIGGKVNYEATKLAVNLDGSILGIETGDVLLYRNDGDEKISCNLSEVTYDNSNQRIILIPEENLEQGAEYEIVLTDSIKVSEGGVTLPYEQTASFYVSEKPAERIYYDGDFLVNGVPLSNDNSDTARTITLDSKLIVAEYSGYAESVQIGEENDRGVSLRMGIKETGASLPSLNVPISSFYSTGQEGELKLDLDYYINEKTNYSMVDSADRTNGAFRLSFYGAGNKTAIFWDQVMLDNYGGIEYEYESGQWYKATVYLSWTPNGSLYNYTFDVYIGKYEGGVCSDDDMVLIAGNKKITGESSIITQIRFYTPRCVDSEKWIAFDDVRITETRELPRIEGFGAGGTMTGNAVDCNADIIEVYLNKPIVGVSKDTVSLKHGGTEIPLAAVGYDSTKNIILLKLKENLADNKNYTFEMSPDTELWDGVTIGKARRAVFTTTSLGVAVDDIIITPQENGIIHVEATVTNVAEDEKNFYIIASIWDGNKFISQKVLAGSILTEGEKTVFLDVENAGQNNTVYVYAWDKILGAKMLTNKIVSYTK